MDTFGRVRWSLRHCGIALGAIIGFKVAFFLFGFLRESRVLSWVSMPLWLLMFVWMIAFPLWAARHSGLLHRPRWRRVLKEFGVAVPVVICLFVLQGLVVFALQRVFGPIEVGHTYDPLRGAPGGALVYWFLIPAFTIGPVAEEFFFRGFLYNALRQRFPLVVAIVLQAVAFALVHWSAPFIRGADVVLVCGMAVALALVYEWRTTLLAPVALHAWYNFAFCGPVIVLMILNSHTPARTWEEAQQPPEWLGAHVGLVEKQATAQEQRRYAINVWGSRGLRMWKVEVHAFEAVCQWFPDDREPCAQARAGIARVFLNHLHDPMRAVIHSDWVLSEYADQAEGCASALYVRARACEQIGEYAESRRSYAQLAELHPSVDWARDSAESGLRELNEKHPPDE